MHVSGHWRVYDRLIKDYVNVSLKIVFNRQIRCHNNITPKNVCTDLNVDCH